MVEKWYHVLADKRAFMNTDEHTQDCAQTIQDYLSLTAERILDLANARRLDLRKVVYDVLSDKRSTYEIGEHGRRYPLDKVARYETDFIDIDVDHDTSGEPFGGCSHVSCQGSLIQDLEGASGHALSFEKSTMGGRGGPA